MAKKYRKKALITGITGQDGSYLTEFLISKGYEVHGIIRRASTFNTVRIDHLYQDEHLSNARLILHYGDLSDGEQINGIIYNIKPDEIYHLGAQSHVRVSFDMPEFTTNITALGTTRILESIKRSKLPIKFFQASSSEMFGSAPHPQSERTPFQPRSPYACAKAYGYWMVKNYRDGYGLFACNGVLFNHESPRRGGTFVTKKITQAVARILAGTQKKLYLGNLDAKRDWGFAPEYVEMMWLMLQQRRPDDYVAGTGSCHSVREFVEYAFRYAGVTIEWRGKGVSEKAVVKKVNKQLPCTKGGHIKRGNVIVEIDPRYFRPTEVAYLKADAAKARRCLKWSPRVDFKDLVKIMVDHDLAQSGITPVGAGNSILKEKKFNYINHNPFGSR